MDEFGSDGMIHPITGMKLENGSGALDPDDQAMKLHCAAIDHHKGKEAGDAMRAKIAAWIEAGKPDPSAVPDTSAQESMVNMDPDELFGTAHEPDMPATEDPSAQGSG